jgi:hypothetical protein
MHGPLFIELWVSMCERIPLAEGSEFFAVGQVHMWFCHCRCNSLDPFRSTKLSVRWNRVPGLQLSAEWEFMGNLKGLVSIVSELRAERTNLVTQLKHIDAALSVLGKLNGGSFYTKPRHTLSAAARRKVSLAQKARWAKRASTNGQVVALKPKRTMSTAARRKIAAFQRARWARVKAQQKKAA